MFNSGLLFGSPSLKPSSDDLIVGGHQLDGRAVSLSYCVSNTVFSDLADSSLKERMLPLCEWSARDRTELQEMLEIAASRMRSGAVRAIDKGNARGGSNLNGGSLNHIRVAHAYAS